MLAAAGAGCEGMFSLTPLERLESFSAEVPLDVADRLLMEAARRHERTLNRGAQAQDRRQRREYRATILIGRCMLLAEGDGSAARMTFTVSLEAPHNDPCVDRLRPVFVEARAGFASVGH